MILSAFTLFHVALSLVGILSGLVVVDGFLTAKRRDGWTALFLATTVLTSVTGFSCFRSTSFCRPTPSGSSPCSFWR